MIIYFSGTGNTQLIAQEIGKRLEESSNSVELISIENGDALDKVDLDGKVLGFGYPVYKFTYPDNFESVISKLNLKSNGNRYFQFSTYARFAANAFSDFSSSLQADKFSLIAQKSFKAPSCGVSAKKAEDDYEYQSVMFFEDAVNYSIDSFVEDILKHDVISATRSNCGLLSKLKSAIVKDIEITKYPRLEIKEDRCTKCGLCAKNCPDKNIIKSDDVIEIIDNKGCLHCLRCMNYCPQNAITFGALTEGDNRYTLKIRDKLFEKSINGHKQIYWANFNSAVKKWRKNTLRYWLSKKLSFK